MTTAPLPSGVTLAAVLDLDEIEVDLYRATTIFDEGIDLYGGQVCAQALLAAGRTVDPSRVPHSLHGYFLRPGDPNRSTVYKVFRDRDGRSFSARRVVAIQNGAVIFNMSTSFHTSAQGDGEQSVTMPDVTGPDQSAAFDLPRLFSFESRLPEQPHADRSEWPTRFWARTTATLPDDPLVHAAALAYLSDISTGILPYGAARPGSSIDHAVWFHEPVDVTAWTLMEYAPRMSGRGRAWYTGSVFTMDGRLVASIAQEALFRAPR